MFRRAVKILLIAKGGYTNSFLLLQLITLHPGCETKNN